MSTHDYDLELEELKRRSVDRLATAEAMDVAAFERLKDYLWSKASGMRTESVISKQVLATVRSAHHTIKSRAEYLPEIRQYLPLAAEFDRLLDRLIAGEIEEDRRPGIPRII